MPHTISLRGRLAVLTISPLCVVRFVSSLRVFHLKFEKEIISYGFMANSCVFRGREVILCDFKELRFCGPRGTCYFKITCLNPVLFTINFKCGIRRSLCRNNMLSETHSPQPQFLRPHFYDHFSTTTSLRPHL